MLVGADVPGGPRPRCRSRCRPRGCGAPGTSRPTMACGMACGHGAGVRAWCGGAGMACAWCVDMVCIVHDGRGRRPRRPASPMSFPMSFPWARRAEDVAPYHGCHGACGHGVWAWRVHGAWTWCAHGAWTWCVLYMLVGADVPGGPRTRVVPDIVPDVVPVGAARRGRRALPWVWAWRVHGCGHGVWAWRVCMVRGHGAFGHGVRT